MYIFAIVLLVINFFLMLLFYLKIRRNFSADRYEAVMQDRMNTILREFNFQTNQAITVLEARIEEMKELIADADKRFMALSKKMSASSRQDKMLNRGAKNVEEIGEENDNFLNAVKENIRDADLQASLEPSSQTTSQQVAGQVDSQVEAYQEVQYMQHDTSQNDAILKMRVVEMYKNGWSIDFIADKLEMPREEVRIITFMARTQE